jgi:hypothetical protein
MGGKKNRQAQLYKAANAMQDGQARSLDELSAYEDFKEMFLPKIRDALLAGKTSEQIMEQFKPVMAARLVQIGATGSESAAINAIKELLDRREGKAVQKQEHTHKLAKLKDEELDAILLSKLDKTRVIEVQGGTVDEEADDGST